MNVSLQKILLTFLLGLLGPLWLWANQTVYLETFQGVSLEYAFTSYPNDPSIIANASFGQVDMVDEGSFAYTLIYTPNADYVGVEVIDLVVWTSLFSFEHIYLNISVLPSKVVAVHDYVTTPINVPIPIEVLANDTSSTGVKMLKNVPLVNNGGATFNEGESFITFTPNTDFEGIAYLNYVVCDDIGTCDHGTVSINVVGPQSTSVDTIPVFTKKNLAQAILIPDGYSLVGGPENGAYDDSSGVPEYTPDTDYIGIDYLNFENGGDQKIFEVHVLEYTPNTFAFDDRLFTTSYESVEANVLLNDGYGVTAGCVYVGTPEYGTLAEHPSIDGLITYTPPPGFTGVDFFTYTSRPPFCAGDAEIATAYVFVSNFEPSAAKFEMNTPKVTPLVISNNIPIQGYSFEVVDQGELGEAIFLPGAVDTLIYGQQITGYNQIVYVPGSNVNSGLDEFEVEYCVLDNGGNCAYVKSIKVEVNILDIGDGSEPMCIGDCVWAGDTNFDGIVNMADLLPLGICMGEIGVPRQEANMAQWYGQYSEDWADPFEGGQIDLKHLDTDGDSVVTALDTMAINQFYGKTHALTSAEIPFLDYPIVLQGSIFANPGDLIELDMVMGSENDPAIDIYGFTIPFPYNPNIFVPQSVEVDYSGASWLAYNSPILHMSRNNQGGLLESGFTRTSGVSASGQGTIGKVRFVVVTDIDGFRMDDDQIPVELGGGSGSVMNSAGQMYGVNIEGFTLYINLEKPEDQEKNSIINPDLLKVYPNPVSNFLNVHLNGGNDFEQVVVYNMTGQEVINTGKVLTNRVQLDVNELDNGMYFMSVFTGGDIINKKFEVIR